MGTGLGTCTYFQKVSQLGLYLKYQSLNSAFSHICEHFCFQFGHSNLHSSAHIVLKAKDSSNAPIFRGIFISAFQSVAGERAWVWLIIGYRNAMHLVVKFW